LAIPGRAFGRRSLHYRRLEPSLQLAQHRTVESGAHRPGVAQRSIDEGPEVKRADRLTVVARALPADDDELGGMVRAHLLPCRRPARAVGGARALRDDALEPERLRLRVERSPVLGHVVGVSKRPASRDDRAQQALALAERQRPDVVWPRGEEIEEVEGGGQLEGGTADVRSPLQPRALLQSLEARQAAVVVD